MELSQADVAQTSQGSRFVEFIRVESACYNDEGLHDR